MAKDERLRNPVLPDYVHALGLATFTFATLEWEVVWSCERIQPGALRRIVDGEITAGTIAKRFANLCRNMPNSAERESLKEIADEFSMLVPLRNRIVHGKPCTGPNGESRLSNVGVIEISNLEDAADAFVGCGAKLNHMLHTFLATYEPQQAAAQGGA